LATPHHRPASRERYAAQHPAITVHFDMDTYNRLIELRKQSGLTLNQLVRQALGSLEEHVAAMQEPAYKRGFAVGDEMGRKVGSAGGYLEARAKYRLTYPCAGCAKPIGIQAGDPAALRAVELLSAEGWGHATCRDAR
jgi:hypothetical protein